MRERLAEAQTFAMTTRGLQVLGARWELLPVNAQHVEICAGPQAARPPETVRGGQSSEKATWRNCKY
jgi:hypothetical protein